MSQMERRKSPGRQNKVLVLPPGCNNKLTQYKLNIQLLSVQLLQISPRPVVLRLQMWGFEQQQHNRIHQNSQISYSINTNAPLFRQYLRDMKVTLLRLCDLRNDQQLGTGLINWIVYMRKVQFDHTPFMQNQFCIPIPILNHRKKQIAQIKIKILWQICKESGRESRKSQCQIAPQLSRYKQDITNIKMPTNDIRDNNKKHISDLRNKNEQIPYQQKNLEYNQLVHISKKGLNNKKQSKFSHSIQQYRTTPEVGVMYPDSKYELQKAKLKLQAEQFLTLTRRANNDNFNTGKQQQSFITAKISDLITIKPNTTVQYIDITIASKRVNQMKQTTPIRKHVRIFPTIKQSNNFINQILLRDKDTVQIQLSKSVAKATFQAKALKQKQFLKVLLYGKSGKFGSFNVAKLSQSNKDVRQIGKQYMEEKKENNTRQIQTKQQTIQKKNNPQIINTDERRLQVSRNRQIGQVNSLMFIMVNISQAKSFQYAQFDVAVKDYKFSKPYPTFNIIPLVELGSIFAIQFRNVNNQSFDCAFIENYYNIPITDQSLGAIVLSNGRINTQHGYLMAEIMIGTIKQINYQLWRSNRLKSNRQALEDNRKPLPNLQYNRNRVNTKSISKQRETYKDKQSQYMQNEIHRQKGLNRQIYKIPKTINIEQQQSQGSMKIKNQYDLNPVRKGRYSKNKIYTEVQRLATQPVNHRQNQEDINMNNMNESKSVNQINGQNDNIWLVQILSKFLHAIPSDKITQLAPPNVEEFHNLLQHFLSNRAERQLIDMVIDMFIDDSSNQSKLRDKQIQNQIQPKLQYQQFTKCVKSYHNFIQLWWKMRVDIIQKLIKAEPNFINKINQYSQLGMISKQKLWKKVFNSVDDPQYQVKVDKMLKLGSGMPISSHYLIEQLRNIQTNPSKMPKQATPQIIMELGKLIKQTIQSILQGSGIVPPTVGQDRINIRIMCDLFQNINVSLSYWQALMLIQQLKAWYNIDNQMNEGIISGSVVQVWLKSVLNRSVGNSSLKFEDQKNTENLKIQEANAQQKQKSSVVRLRPQIQELYKQRNTPSQNINRSSLVNQNKFPYQNNVVSQNPSQRIGTVNRLNQNKSIGKSQLNQQQIQNIANLLRDNDNFRLGTFSSEKPPSKVYNQTNTVLKNQSRKEVQNTSRILNDDILNESNDQLSQNNASQLYNDMNKFTHANMKKDKRQMKENAQNVDKSPFYLLTKIKLFKIKQNKKLQFPIKLSMKIYSGAKDSYNAPNRQHYFFLNSKQQIEGKQFVEELFYNWQRSSKGLIIQFRKMNHCINQLVDFDHKANQQGPSHKFQDPQVLFYGILLSDEIQDIIKSKKNWNDLGQNKSTVIVNKSKTIVLYGGKQIVGKVGLQLQVSKNKQEIYYCEQKVHIMLQIQPDRSHSNQWNKYNIKTAKATQLYPHQETQIPDENISIPSALIVQKHKRYTIQLNGSFYKQILNIYIEGVGMCSVPLQQLYFKKEITGQYPVINDSDGQFYGNLYVRLYNTLNIIENALNTDTNHNMNVNNQIVSIQDMDKEDRLQKKHKYLVIFDSITTLYKQLKPKQQSKQKLQVTSFIIVKDSNSRVILYKSPYYIQHEHKISQKKVHTTYISQYSSQNYLILQDTIIYTNKSKSITVQLQYQTRHVGIGKAVIKLSDYQHSGFKYGTRLAYQMKYTGSNSIQVLLRMGMRVIPIPSSHDRYNVKRIYKSICKFKSMEGQKQVEIDHYINKLIQQNSNLTMTEQRLLRQMAISNLSKDIDQLESLNKFRSCLYINIGMNRNEYLKIANQLIMADFAFQGRLKINKINQIVSRQVGGDLAESTITNYLIAYSTQHNYPIRSKQKETQQQQIDYIGLLQFMDTDNIYDYSDNNENHAGQLVPSILDTELGTRAVNNIDRLYKQIKNKYK